MDKRFKPERDLEVFEDLSGTEIVMRGSRGGLLMLALVLYSVFSAIADVELSFWMLSPIGTLLFVLRKHYRFSPRTMSTYNSIGPLQWGRKTLVCSDVANVTTSELFFVSHMLTIELKDGTVYRSYTGNGEDHLKIRDMIFHTAAKGDSGSIEDIPDAMTALKSDLDGKPAKQGAGMRERAQPTREG